MPPLNTKRPASAAADGDGELAISAINAPAPAICFMALAPFSENLDFYDCSLIASVKITARSVVKLDKIRGKGPGFGAHHS
jgi:hypothetical protein